MKTKLYSFAILPMLFLMTPNRCTEAEYRDNTRIYVEGKTNSPNIPVQLINDGILITKTSTMQDGSFGMGGPGTTQQIRIVFGKKIESFESSVPNLYLNYDSLSIGLPENINYVQFKKIQFAP